MKATEKGATPAELVLGELRECQLRRDIETANGLQIESRIDSRYELQPGKCSTECRREVDLFNFLNTTIGNIAIDHLSLCSEETTYIAIK